MSWVVVDTNVPVVANAKSDQASSDCVVICIGKLQQITGGRVRLVLDDQWLIVREYQSNLRSSGQPGVGDAFLKWVLTNKANPTKCELVSITPLDSQANNFREFPKDAALNDFDPSDRKFVAVALAHPEKPPILQAVDSLWWGVREALHQNGVRVDFICEADIKALHARRQRR